MSIYRYPASPVVDEIHFVKTEKGGVRAYLQAAPGATQEMLKPVLKAVKDEEWIAVPFTLDGKSMLEVRAFGKPYKLIEGLERVRAVQGEPLKETPKDDHKSFIETLKQRSLQVSGLFYMIGDASFISYGWRKSSKEDFIGGILYALGTLSLVTFGNNDQADLQIEEKGKALEQFLIKENVRIPQSCTLHTLSNDHDKGVLRNTYDWMRSHPAEMLNTIYVGAGACIAAGALRHKLFKQVADETVRAKRTRIASGLLDLGLGTTTSAVSLIGNLVKEKKRDPDEPLPHGMIEKTMAWVEEKPLRVTGYGMMLSTMCHAVSTAIDYKEAVRTNNIADKKNIPLRALFVGANLIAETMIALSSKGHGEGVTSDESVDKSTYAIAAELILKQPEADREWHIQHLAGFLQQPNVLAESYEVVEKNLREEVAKLQNNPWLCQAQPAPTSEPEGSAAKPHVTKTVPASWQARIHAEPAAALGLQT